MAYTVFRKQSIFGWGFNEGKKISNPSQGIDPALYNNLTEF
jgi:hypothetical protein